MSNHVALMAYHLFNDECIVKFNLVQSVVINDENGDLIKFQVIYHVI